MSRCKECGGVDVHHVASCSKAVNPRRREPKPVRLPPPPPPPSLRGRVFVLSLPDGDVTGIVTDERDDDGNVGFFVLSPNFRVAPSDLKETP